GVICRTRVGGRTLAVMRNLVLTCLIPLVGIAAPAGAQQQQQPERPERPAVLIVATGGTIASTNYYSGNSSKIGIGQVLEAVPALDSVGRISTQQFANVSSTQVSPA